MTRRASCLRNATTGALLALLAPAMTTAADFTLVAVGDLVISRPISMLQQPGAFDQSQRFADTVALLKRSDVTYGNFETVIVDARHFAGAPYSWDGDWMLSSTPQVAADLVAMHFNLVSRANNHALDWGLEGARESDHWLAAAGLANAGMGENAEQAATARYYSTAKGQVALVSMASTFRPTTEALPVSNALPRGRPGINGLKVTENFLLDEESFRQVAGMACQFTGAAPCTTKALPTSFDLFGAHIRRAVDGEEAFTHHYEMDGADLERILRGVRAAKPAARYLVVSIHAHEHSSDEDPPGTWEAPAAFLRTLAHRAIDEGADAFVTTGIHHVGGIELYRGKPIFYGLGNFIWSDIQLPLSADLYQGESNRNYLQQSFTHPEWATDADLTLLLNANSTFATAGEKSLNRTFQGVLTRTLYDDATQRVKEIRLYPIDLGYGEKLTRSGIPRRAADPIANLVLDRIISLSGNSGLDIKKVTEDGYLIGVAEPR